MEFSVLAVKDNITKYIKGSLNQAKYQMFHRIVQY